ncbi:hypothetical protein JET14_12005 [Martelella lutilitoris]|uniref:Uncharacterized protein n=1 Tax=Martelella lutilitoris TaxID=2583532 RepID=A0A7T7HH55_9HYPH|nr:hypothetical protein [Martelella lutilitoris]QQM29062.1 hypothetical protein JET14_12005 [Martelella lutilitoris]
MALTASACSPDSPEPVIRLVSTRVDVPETSRQSCLSLMSVLPEDGGLSEEEVTNKWGQDRVAVKVCDSRRAGAVASVDNANAAAEAATGEKSD